jgi:outer membrane receptor protein involved in Fe transport
MRLGAFLLISLLFQESLQGQAQTITYQAKNGGLEDFFAAVIKQTNYVFFYDNTIIAVSNPVNLDLRNASVSKALSEAFRNQPLIFNILGNTIFVTLKSPIGQDNVYTSSLKNNSLVTVKGKIKDSLGNLLADVSIKVKNKKTGTTSNLNGVFFIQALPGDTLQISSVGFKSREITAQNEFLSIIMLGTENPLNEVIVGGNMMATKRKTETTSVTVVNANTLDALPYNEISEIFRGLIPGTNSFSTGDHTHENATFTIRGAGGYTSISTIAVYVDGIEYAGGSGFLATLNKENIFRIEVLRGPASSTLYGTGSNGGIVQIFTKTGISGQNQLNFTASAGFLNSKWVSSPAFQQYYSVQSVAGFKKAAWTVGGSYNSTGAYLPEARDNSKSIFSNLKWDISKKLTTNFAVQYENDKQHESRNPLYDTCLHPNASAIAYGLKPVASPNTNLLADYYLAGVNITYKTTERWTNNLTAGYTQNGFKELPINGSPDTTAPIKKYYHSVNQITTIRYYNFLMLGNLSDQAFHLNILSGAEYKKYFSHEIAVANPPVIIDNSPPNENYGAFIQANPSYKNVYLTLGLRYEYNDLFKNNSSLNPRIGATTNFKIEDLIVKPRISWGSGITPPAYTDRYGYPSDGYSAQLPNPNIKPQDQQGFDYALEFFSSQNNYKLEIIHYDNLLKNMIVYNAVSFAPSGLATYVATNIGAVANTGWEFSGEYKFNRHFNINGTFSIMNSVVKDTTGNYLSETLSSTPPGSRLSNLPRHTAGLFLNYNVDQLFGKKHRADISINMTEVDGVLTLDVIRYTVDVAYGRFVNFSNYIVTSATAFRFGLNFDYYFSDNWRLFVQGQNIANSYNPEQRNDWITYGASWMFGVKFNISHTAL